MTTLCGSIDTGSAPDDPDQTLCWQALGIAPTTDFAAIERAYAAQADLPTYSRDLVGAIRLRRLYQDALAAADRARPGGETFKSADLSRRILSTWKQGGDQALLAAWPAILDTLDKLHRDDWMYASKALAHVVLGNRALPLRFVDALRRHFVWAGIQGRWLCLSIEDTEELRQRMIQVIREVSALDAMTGLAMRDQSAAARL
ncbi:hypothetical protein [Massilia genomosp. 1]|uniref:J domain-containing protein n=1 Tax=Massilia genomosp. 1 TaxID=2609280 RepID=A0ABX0MHR6_9BURK|nr:hypothetical protein [Massilia genomosp. 1]NHZ61572.1 hypothetical protein [Massilia genomosp. 1]